MKTKLLAALAGCLFSFSAFAQSSYPVYQTSEGGTPWSFKYAESDNQIPIMNMGSIDLQALQDEDAINDQYKDRVWRFGYNHFVNYDLNNSGDWKTLGNGDRIWRLGVTCPGALTVNLAFQYVSIPEGARLFIYNEDKDLSLGAFTQNYVAPDLELGTELIPGETVFIEYYVPASCPNIGSLELFRVTHGYRDALDYANRAFGSSGSCNMNVNCPDGAPWTDQINSTVMLVSGGSGFCTGALINNSCNDGTPYVLTANHCGTASGSWVFRFNWQSANCPNPGSSPSFTSISGATQRADRPAADMALAELTSGSAESDIQAYGGYYAGWDKSGIAPPSAVCVHHPSGDIKKISFDDNPLQIVTAMGGETNCCWRLQWDRSTTTEPGSSGSPVFDNNGRIIGQLWGGGASCTNLTAPDYYGRVSQNWNPGGPNNQQLAFWLDPAGCSTGADYIDGYDPNAPSLTWDAQVQTINTPTGNLCDGSSISPEIVLRNNGTNTLTSVTINYIVDGGPPTAYPWTGSLTTGTSTTVTMPTISVGGGPHTYQATIVPNTLNGSNTDLNAANDSQTSNFTIVSSSAVSLPFSEGFEGVTFPPTDWTNENPDANTGYALWERTTTCSGFGGSTACAEINHLDPPTSTDGQVDNLKTPFIDLTSASTPIDLTFSVANCRYNGTYYDSLIVWISTDCEGSWTRLASYGSGTLVTAGNQTTTFIPTSGEWDTKTINLNAYASETSVKINFQLKSGWGQYTYIDDINIVGASAPPTAGLSTSATTVCEGETVTYTNTSAGETSITWDFPGGSPPNGSSSPINVTYNTAGTYTTTLTATNTFGTSTTTTVITVNSLPAVSLSGLGSTCANYAASTLFGGTPSGGTYSGTGVSAGQFDPGVAGVGVHNITYTYTDGNGCTNNAVSTIEVLACLGVEDDENGQVSIYPNPTDNVIYISGLDEGDHDFALLNTVGQVIANGVINNGGLIQLGTLSPGTYYVRINNKVWKVIKM